MIKIDAAFDNDGVLKSCSVAGHAGSGTKGYDIVCAAVSALVMAASETLQVEGGIKAKLSAAKRGEFFLEASAESAEDKIFLKAIGKLLTNGFKAVEREFPNNCSVGVTHGT
ncbi:MAG: hypothetical protein Ta2G_06000 [Termitinemataceae bacterium]|nr:MAG: hypothetical protein Ta2G_06000 [Termitinemataceae bacterium]